MPFLIYAAVLLIAAASMALGIDLMTRPEFKPKTQVARTAPNPVRQIPIGRGGIGDPNGDLSPVYPAHPGKNLPIPDSGKTQKTAAAPARAETSGSGGSATEAAPREPAQAGASATVPSPAQTAGLPAQSAAPNSCNVQACASAYQSFRAADCSYQPYNGPRKLCDVAAPQDNIAARPAQDNIAARPEPRARPAIRDDDDELDDVVRTVKRLPDPAMVGDGGIVVLDRPDGSRYGLRRHWVIEGR